MEIPRKKVLITGGATGIGLAVANEFARLGANVIVTDVNARALIPLRPRFHVFELDVTSERSIQNARGKIHREVGHIDILINNAGIVWGGPFCDVPLTKHHQTIAINLGGAISVTHAFLPDLISSKGSLVFISSASGFVGLPNGSTYAASKWGLIGFAESLRNELRSLINVSIVCPSYVDTGLFAGARAPFLTSLLTPEVVATNVCRAVEHAISYVKLPWTVSLIGILRAFLPVSAFDFAMKRLAVSSSMLHWTGKPTGPNKHGKF